MPATLHTLCTFTDITKVSPQLSPEFFAGCTRVPDEQTKRLQYYRMDVRGMQGDQQRVSTVANDAPGDDFARRMSELMRRDRDWMHSTDFVDLVHDSC